MNILQPVAGKGSANRRFRRIFSVLAVAVLLGSGSAFASSLSSPNIPLDSPIYLYIEKLSGFGLVTSDFKGIRPYSRSEVARLLLEAEGRVGSGDYPPLAGELVTRIRELIPREAALYAEPERAPLFDYDLASMARLRYVYLDGAPRDYHRQLVDPAGDWSFPLPYWRPKDTNPLARWQRGTEGTPLSENNEGIIYNDGSNLEGRVSSEAYFKRFVSGVIEPLLLWSEHDEADLDLNKGYLKVGGGPVELELGKDSNWLGIGYRGALILTNNAQNFTGVKLWSPEPVVSKYLWDLKYELLVSQFERTDINGNVRQPYFYAMKLSMKPYRNLELGLNLGRQVGGTGVDNGFLASVRGLVGATNNDNSNSLAGMELRWRMPFLRNTEIYMEMNGEDRNGFWPKTQSYVAGFFVPSLTPSGRDDLRFEYFSGQQILYTHSTFPAGYLYHDLPVGHSQGGGTEDFFLRYSHWFTPRSILALEASFTTRGEIGRLTVDETGKFDRNGRLQGMERKAALRGLWSMPLYREWNGTLMYGWETIQNWNLRPGVDHTNNLVRADLTYRY